MMPPEENHSGSPTSTSRSMVERHFFTDGALADPSALNGGAALNGFGSIPQSPDILNNSVDPLWLLHSFRRRWVLATGLGVLIATVLAGLVYWLTPNETTAMALIEVKSAKPIVVFKDSDLGDGIGDYERYQKTQVRLITSHFVLTAALREVDGLPAIRKEKHKLSWLRDRLEVGFGDESEILQIAMTGDEPASELHDYVDAVVQAYMEEVVYKVNREREEMLAELRTASRKNAALIASKRQDYIQQADAKQTEDGKGVSIERAVITEKLSAINESIRKIDADLAGLGLEYDKYKKLFKDPSYLDQQDQKQMESDAILSALMQQADYDDYQLAQQMIKSTTGNSRSQKRLSEKIAKTRNLISERQAELKRSYEAQRNSRPNEMLRQLRQDHDLMREFYTKQRGEKEAEVTKLMDDAKELGVRDAKLEMLQAEIERRGELQTRMESKIWESEVEQEAPPRIQIVQPTTTNPNLESYQRYIIVAMAWLFGFGLTGFGIAYLEFQAKRLNEPKQVDEGLGIRVVGALPSLAFRGETDGADPVLAILMESIDNVRTTLMNDSTSKDRRVVMVTSASGHEGRTTVASQLAASLARAGRRTLLIDGDLRHPSLHGLFDVPLEDGLCEVLRAEADVDDVVQPTHAEGLWLLTAGYCNVDAIQALAKDQLQPVFDRLRNQYDFIIVDAAPALNLSDTLIMGQHVDGAIVSVLRDVSKVPQVHQVNELLRSLGIPIFGAVVNGVRGRVDVRTERLHMIAPPQVVDETPEEVSAES